MSTVCRCPYYDNFFVIGGLLTGYLMKKYYDKHGEFSWSTFFMAILNRTLRLMPTIGAAIGLSLMFFGHQGGINEETGDVAVIKPNYNSPPLRPWLNKGFFCPLQNFNVFCPPVVPPFLYNHD